ncbi:MAG: 3-hydroxyacyl-ACP dehydratase FabZ [Alphaproteobacteria bacterium]
MAEAPPAKTLEAMDIQRLLVSLPHRYPFLMVDRVIEIDGDNSGIGIKNVTVNEPHFTGHFPGRPVMPGVLLIEAMAQTAGAICVLAKGWERPPMVYFVSIDEARFRKPVVPGDTVHIHVRKTRNRGNLWKYKAEARVDGAIVAEAEVGAVIMWEEPT